MATTVPGPLVSPSRSAGAARFEGFASHPTSSLRDPLPDATPPEGSRSPSEDDFLAHQTRGSAQRRPRKGKGRGGDDAQDGDSSDSDHASKRRKTGSASRRAASPSHQHAASNSQIDRRLLPQLAPIRPIGFRESRAGDDRPIPSPVVMGFDFQGIDGEQLKTVRDTISIKEQQQALIAQRRRENAASTPNTPKELTFKGWTPKDPKFEQQAMLSAGSTTGGGGVGRRREKTRDKVERMSIVTSSGEKDVVPGSKSAPLNAAALASQQASPRDAAASGSQTAHIPHHGNYPYHHYPYPPDPRTAPLSNARGDYPPASSEYYTRPLGPPRAPSDRSRNFTAPSMQHPPPSHQNHNHNGGESPSPTRDSLVQPYNQLYDLMRQTDQLRFALQDLLARYEGQFKEQDRAVKDFKATASQASGLLGTLQESAESLREMVRYEVRKAVSPSNGAGAGTEDPRDQRIRELEERLERLERGSRGEEGGGKAKGKDAGGSKRGKKSE